MKIHHPYVCLTWGVCVVTLKALGFLPYLLLHISIVRTGAAEKVAKKAELPSVGVSPEEVPPELAHNPLIHLWQTLTPAEAELLTGLAELDHLHGDEPTPRK